MKYQTVNPIKAPTAIVPITAPTITGTSDGSSPTALEVDAKTITNEPLVETDTVDGAPPLTVAVVAVEGEPLPAGGVPAALEAIVAGGVAAGSELVNGKHSSLVPGGFVLQPLGLHE